MVEKDKPNNVKPIRKGVQLEEPKLEPIPDLVAQIELLLELAKSGDLREFAYVGVTADPYIHSGVMGNPYDCHYMMAQLIHLKTKYYEEVFWPMIEGAPYFEE